MLTAADIARTAAVNRATLAHTHHVFARLDPAALDAVAAIARVRYFPRKRPLYRQGEPGLYLFLLREGRGKLTHVNCDGAEALLWTLATGTVFGAVETGAYSCTAVPTTDISVMEWNREQLLLRLPQLAVRLGEHSADRLRELEQRLCEMATCSVPHRLAIALLRICATTERGEVPYGCEELAQHVGTTLFTVSRCLTAWKRAGLIEGGMRREYVRVLDLEALRRITSKTIVGERGKLGDSVRRLESDAFNGEDRQGGTSAL